jgi:hypothetical protein
MSSHANIAVRAVVSLVLVLGSGCGIETNETPIDDAGAGHGHTDTGVSNDGSVETGVKTRGEEILEATDASAWIYVRLGVGAIGATVADPKGWDVRVSRTKVATNSGTSGTGLGGAIATEARAIDAAIVCPTEGYAIDATLPVPGPPGSGEYSGNPAMAEWFDYDPATHVTTSKGIVYCVKTADGRYGALRIKNYTGGRMTVEWRFQPSGAPAL